MNARSSGFLLLGVHGELLRPKWKLGTSANMGSALGQNEGRWILADADITRSWYGKRQTFSLAADAFALRYDRPFDYQAFVGEVHPALTVRVGSLLLTALPRAAAGTWSSDTLGGDIGVVGSAVQLAKVIGPLTAAITGEAHHATNGLLDGTYRGAGVNASVALGSLTFGGSLQRWRDPEQTEWGYGAFASLLVGNSAEINARVARSVTDPVLATPGSLGASVGMSLRLFSHEKRVAPAVARVEQRAQKRMVVFTIESDAANASVSGSFSGWQPIPMRKIGRVFTVEVAVPPGTHHYGFMLNGTDWYVPKNAVGIVDDDFGRKNATLVIERR